MSLYWEMEQKAERREASRPLGIKYGGELRVSFRGCGRSHSREEAGKAVR